MRDRCRFSDEFLATEQFDTLLKAQILAEDWRNEYNTTRPHGAPTTSSTAATGQRNWEHSTTAI